MLRSIISKSSTIQTVSRGFQATEQIPMKAGPIQFVRGKRTKRTSSVSPATQRIITQLSVFSARKKVPRVLKLCAEDLVRHDTITKAWAVYQKDKRTKLQDNLAKQYNAMNNAMEDLKQSNRELYELANAKQIGKRFPLDARIPTQYPPNKIWYYDFTSKEPKQDKK